MTAIYRNIFIIYLSLNVYFSFSSLNVLKNVGDETRSVPEMIKSRGYKPETHYVKTKDGYILTIHRIVNEKSMKKVKRPVILQHGLLGSSYDFIMNSEGLGIKNSRTFYKGKVVSNNLGFALAMFSFDVWLTNTRGNEFGRNHTKISPIDSNFWRFTFDEMVAYDLPAVINYIRRATNHATLAYVGHSQGTLIMFALLSERPEYSKIIKPFIAMAPVAKVGHIKSPIRYIATNPLLMNYFYYSGGEFLPSTDLIHFIAQIFCKEYVIAAGICSNALFLFAGFDSNQLNLTRVPVYLSHVPATTSAWNIVHFGQMIASNKFRKFDYGSSENLKRYGSRHPPTYKLKNINSTNIAILSSVNDFMANPRDVRFLKKQLKGKLLLDYTVPHKQWNHLDFLWAAKAAKYVNVVVLDTLKKFKSKQFLPSGNSSFM